MQTEGDAINNLMQLYGNDASAAFNALSLVIKASQDLYSNRASQTSLDLSTYANLPVGTTAAGAISIQGTNLTWSNITVTENGIATTVKATTISLPDDSASDTHFKLTLSGVEAANSKSKVTIPTLTADLTTTNAVKLSDQNATPGDSTLTLALGDAQNPIKVENIPQNGDKALVFEGSIGLEALVYDLGVNIKVLDQTTFFNPKSIAFKGKLSHDAKSTAVDVSFVLNNADQWKLSTQMIKGLDQVSADGTVPNYFTLTATDALSTFGDTTRYGFKQYDFSGVSPLTSTELAEAQKGVLIAQTIVDNGLLFDPTSSDPGTLDLADPNNNSFVVTTSTNQTVTVTKQGVDYYEWSFDYTDANSVTHTLTLAFYKYSYSNSYSLSIDGSYYTTLTAYTYYGNGLPEELPVPNTSRDILVSLNTPISIYINENIPYTLNLIDYYSSGGTGYIPVYFNQTDGAVIVPPIPKVVKATAYQAQTNNVSIGFSVNGQTQDNFYDFYTPSSMAILGISTDGDDANIEKWVVAKDSSYDLSDLLSYYQTNSETEAQQNLLRDSYNVGLSNCYQPVFNQPVYQCSVSSYSGYGEANYYGEYQVDLSNGLPQAGSSLTADLNLYNLDLNPLLKVETYDFNPKYTATASIDITGFKDSNGDAINPLKLTLEAKRNGVLAGSGGLSIGLNYNGQQFKANYRHHNILTKDNFTPSDTMKNLQFTDGKGGEIILKNLGFNSYQTCNAYDYYGNCYAGYSYQQASTPYRGDIYYNGIKHGYIFRDTINHYGAGKDALIASLKDGTEVVLWKPNQP